MRQVKNMMAGEYFAYAAELMKVQPTHATDWSILARMKGLGFEPGKSFDLTKAKPAVRSVLERAVPDARKLMEEKTPTLAPVLNGWQMNIDTMEVYGNYYLKRAIVAMIGLGANQPEDAVYPMCVADTDGDPLQAENNYVLHWPEKELPPVGAFWSLTMYDAEGY